MPNAAAAAIDAVQVSTNVSSSAAAAITMPEISTIVFLRPSRSEIIPPTMAVSTTPAV